MLVKKNFVLLAIAANFIVQSSVLAKQVLLGRHLENTEYASNQYLDTGSIKARATGNTRRFQFIQVYDILQTDIVKGYQYKKATTEFIVKCDEGTLSDPIRSTYYDSRGTQVGKSEFEQPEFELPTEEYTEKIVDDVCSAKF